MKHTNEILAIANTSYNNGELNLDKEAPDGDGLALFIRNEIIDVTKGAGNSEEAFNVSVLAIEKAVSELQGVLHGIEHAAYQQSGLAPRPRDKKSTLSP